MYSIIIDLFLKHSPQYNDIKYKPVLTRTILKTIIMVVNYNAGEYRCLKYLQEKLMQEKINYKDIDLKTLNSDLYKFLTDILFNYFFINNKEEFLKRIGHSLDLNDAHINLSYLNVEQKQEVVKIAGLRWIFNKKYPTHTICNIKTAIAINANIIQASDGELLRYLTKNIDMLAVHDSFTVSIFNLHKLMDTTNLFFNQKLKINTYGFFILI